MPPKKRGGRRSRAGDSDEDDATSTCTRTTLGTQLSEWDDEPGSIDDNPFDVHIDALYEKRSSTREKGLQGLCSLLASNYCYDEAVLKLETLSSLFLGSLRRGGTGEAALAARGLGLHFVTLGSSDEAERLLPEATQALKHAAAQGKSPAVRAAAAEALAIAVFVAETDAHEVARAMAALAAGFKSPSPPVAAAHLRGWALLLSTLCASRQDSDFVEASLGALAACLHAQDVEVRAAAGHAIALLHSASGLAALLEDDEEEEGGYYEDEGEEEQAAALRALAPGLDEVVTRMRDLATNRGDRQRRSKKERASLRGTFRSLCGTLEGGQVGRLKVKLPYGDVLVVESLEGRTQLEGLRGFLAEGFQAHLQENPLLHAVFNFTPSAAPPQRLSVSEKRALRTPGSKARAQQRGKARSATARYKGGMMGGEDW